MATHVTSSEQPPQHCRRVINITQQLMNREIGGCTVVRMHPDLITHRREQSTTWHRTHPTTSSGERLRHQLQYDKMFLRALTAINSIDWEMGQPEGLRSRGLYDALNYLTKRIADNAGNTNNSDFEQNFLIYFDYLDSMGLFDKIKTILCADIIFPNHRLTQPKILQSMLNKLMCMTMLRKLFSKKTGNLGEGVCQHLCHDAPLLQYIFYCAAVPGLTLPVADIFEDLFIFSKKSFSIDSSEVLNFLLHRMNNEQVAVFSRVLGMSIRDLEPAQTPSTADSDDDENNELEVNLTIQRKNLDHILRVPGILKMLMSSMKSMCIRAMPRYVGIEDESTTWRRHLDDLFSAQIRSGYTPGPVGQMSEDLLTYTALVGFGGRRTPSQNYYGRNVADLSSVPANLSLQPTLDNMTVMNSALSLINFVHLLLSTPRCKHICRSLAQIGFLSSVIQPIFERFLWKCHSDLSPGHVCDNCPEAVLKAPLLRLIRLFFYVAEEDPDTIIPLLLRGYSHSEIRLLKDINSKLPTEVDKDDIITDSAIDPSALCLGRVGFFGRIVEILAQPHLVTWNQYWLSSILDTYLRVLPKPSAYQVFFKRTNLIKLTVKSLVTCYNQNPGMRPPYVRPINLNPDSPDNDLMSTNPPPGGVFSNAGYALDPELGQGDSTRNLLVTSFDLLGVLIRFNPRNAAYFSGRISQYWPGLGKSGSTLESYLNEATTSSSSTNLGSVYYNREELHRTFCSCLSRGSDIVCDFTTPSDSLYHFLLTLQINPVEASLMLRSLLVTQFNSGPAQSIDSLQNDEVTWQQLAKAIDSNCWRISMCDNLIKELRPEHINQRNVSALTSVIVLLYQAESRGLLEHYIIGLYEIVSNKREKYSTEKANCQMAKVGNLIREWSQRYLSNDDFHSIDRLTGISRDQFQTLTTRLLSPHADFHMQTYWKMLAAPLSAAYQFFPLSRNSSVLAPRMAYNSDTDSDNSMEYNIDLPSY